MLLTVTEPPLSHDSSLNQRLVAEFLGTSALTATVVGSGIMATRLTDDVALQLLLNAVATGAALGVLIWTLAPVSGAHINPVVSLIAAINRDIAPGLASTYICFQFLGAVAGTAIADLMFDLPAWTLSTTERNGPGVLLGEVIATTGLLVTIGAAQRMRREQMLAVLVPAWIVSAYFFTSSTSFANPAVTLGRALTDTFSGIAPADVPAFVLMQVVGACLGAATVHFLYRRSPADTSVPSGVGGST